jgi:hypothetical protein
LAIAPSAPAIIIHKYAEAIAGQSLDLFWDPDPSTVYFYITEDWTKFYNIGVAPTEDASTIAHLPDVDAG